MTPALESSIRSAILSLEGWCWPEKALAMAQLILDVRPATVVEIGVFGGRSLIPQALALRELGSGTAYGIDPWRREDATEGTLSSADLDWWSHQDLDVIHTGCMHAIWRSGASNHCVILRAPSQLCPLLFGGGIQILHIDGAHSVESATRDIRLYLPQVPAGGHIWVDDINWEGVAAASALLDACCERVASLERPGGGGLCVLFKRR